MSAAQPSISIRTKASNLGDGSSQNVVHVTLLELVQAVGQVTSNDREVVTTVLHMLESGRAKLTGNFRGREFDAFRKRGNPSVA